MKPSFTSCQLPRSEYCDPGIELSDADAALNRDLYKDGLSFTAPRLRVSWQRIPPHFQFTCILLDSDGTSNGDRSGACSPASASPEEHVPLCFYSTIDAVQPGLRPETGRHVQNDAREVAQQVLTMCSKSAHFTRSSRANGGSARQPSATAAGRTRSRTPDLNCVQGQQSRSQGHPAVLLWLSRASPKRTCGPLKGGGARCRKWLFRRPRRLSCSPIWNLAAEQPTGLRVLLQ